MTLVSNAKWNTLSQFFKVFSQLINIVYLAKIIPPSEYGLMAMAIVFINLGFLLRDLGTSAAIIQRKVLDNSLINTIFWLNTFMGIGLAIIISLLSPAISDLYHQPKLMVMIIMLSITFPLSSCAAAHLALLERNSEFRKVSTIEITSSLCSLIVAITMAKLGFGVYSLIAQAIVLNLMSAIQLWIASSWRPSFSCFVNVDDIRNIFGFSANLSFFNFINYFSRNADSFIIGKFMSSAILGNYNLAYRIMLFPLQSLTFVATRSLYPILSKHQDDNKKIEETYLNCVFVILLITAPLMCGLAFFSKPFIFLVFGEQWSLTAGILVWLAPTAIIQSVLSMSGSVFMAKGRTDILMKLGILGTILQVGAFLIGVNFNINTFAMCYLISNIINFFPVMLFLLKTIDSNFFLFFRKIYPIIFSVIIMILALQIISLYFPLSKIDGFFTLLFFSSIGAVIYFFALLIMSSFIRKIIFLKFLR